MTLLEDVVDVDDLEKEIDADYINCRFHPEYPYAILNYSDKAQFDNRWTDTIRNCRGLIYHIETGKVIARGMPKFFNYNQAGAPEFALDDVVHVADKADGSLGILYPTPDGEWAVATRGSFESEQALWATQFLRDYPYYRVTGADLDDFADKEGSVVVEIIFPNNHIVVNYGDAHELRLLGTVGVPDGVFYPSEAGDEYWWPFGVSQSFGEMTYGEALALPPRPNAEGLVLTRVSDGAMVKVKQEDYLRLHKAIFGLSARKLWEILVAGDDMDAYIASLPDELHEWAKETARSIELLALVKVQHLRGVFENLLRATDFGGDRAVFAKVVQENVEAADRWAMFALLDNKDIYPVVLKKSKPEAFITPVVNNGEDEA